MATQKKQFKSIDEYINSFPDNIQKILENIRKIIHSTAPKATESVSYGIPVFNLNGKYLIYFAAWKQHISLYPIPRNETLKKELSPYIKGKGTIQFPLNQSIPYHVIEKMVIFRMQENRGNKQ